MINDFEQLTVQEVLMRKRSDGTGEFPVALIQGISLTTSATSGSQSFTKRVVHLPLNGLTLAEAKQAFPAGKPLHGFRIERYQVADYTFEVPAIINPDTKEVVKQAETIKANVRYRLVDVRAEVTEAAQAPQSTREAVPAQPAQAAQPAPAEQAPAQPAAQQPPVAQPQQPAQPVAQQAPAQPAPTEVGTDAQPG